MSDTERAPEPASQSLIHRPLSRRQILRGGLVASGAAFLAACGQSAATSAPSAAPSLLRPPHRRCGTAAPSAAATAAPSAAATAARDGSTHGRRDGGADAWPPEDFAASSCTTSPAAT